MIFIYPNVRGRLRGDEEGRGVLRNGFVDDNQDMENKQIVGLPAYVTQEQDGQVRFYVFLYREEVPFYCGPYLANSEEIVAGEILDNEYSR